MAAFDWYQGTVHASENDVLGALMEASQAPSLRHAKGPHGYATASTVEAADGFRATVWHGGVHQHPHVVTSGESAQAGSEILRREFPIHFVTRADAREDYADEGAFDRILPSLLDVAKSHRVKVGTAGDHLLTMEGRTVYLGSTKSACRLRLYDKAAELRSQFASDPDRLADVPDHLTRLEAQVRPQTKAAKEAFATIQPLAVMGSSAWMRAVWLAVEGMELEAVKVGKPWRQSDHERTYWHLLMQYRPVFEAMFQDLGDWPCVGLQIGDDLAKLKKRRQ